MESLKEFLSKFDIVQEVAMGNENEKKYYVKIKNEEFFLKIRTISDYTRYKNIFEKGKMFFENGIPTPKPLEFNICGDIVYIRYEMINGEVLLNYLRLDLELNNEVYKPEKQYETGITLGKVLKKIHNQKPLNPSENWLLKFEAKMKSAIEIFTEDLPKETPLEKEMLLFADDLLEYFEKNKEIIAKRPNTILHGDFAPVNIMVKGEKMWVIDLELEDGDPYSDFLRVPFYKEIETFETGKPLAFFSSGVIDGYFNVTMSSDIPIEFWKLFKLYMLTDKYIRFTNNPRTEKRIRRKEERELFLYNNTYK